MSKKIFSNIPAILKDARKGKMFVLVDDENRENEGDLVVPGSKCNSNIINFMAKHGRGLICLALTKRQVDNLKLPLMSQINKSRMQTAFTVSIEARKGISTGISAFDFIEHIPRVLYAPGLRFSFVELMNEIYRCLKKGGRFVSFTPCYPSPVAFQDPTHVNIITEATFPNYFCEPALWAKMYGFKGKFKLEKQNWNKENTHLITLLSKM